MKGTFIRSIMVIQLRSLLRNMVRLFLYTSQERKLIPLDAKQLVVKPNRKDPATAYTRKNIHDGSPEVNTSSRFQNIDEVIITGRCVQLASSGQDQVDFDEQDEDNYDSDDEESRYCGPEFG
jgi:hypothetical protein